MDIRVDFYSSRKKRDDIWYNSTDIAKIQRLHIQWEFEQISLEYKMNWRRDPFSVSYHSSSQHFTILTSFRFAKKFPSIFMCLKSLYANQRNLYYKHAIKIWKWTCNFNINNNEDCEGCIVFLYFLFYVVKYTRKKMRMITMQCFCF